MFQDPLGMVSPVHLCLVLMLDYFQADRGRVFRKLIPLNFSVLGVAAVIAAAVEIL